MSNELQSAMRRFEECITTRDRALAETVLDADYALVLVQPTAVVMPRERWLAVLPDYVVHSLDVVESHLDVSEDLAVFLHRDEMSATVLGQDRSGVFVLTDVWRRTADGWRIWRRHSTPLSAGLMPGTPAG